MSLFEFFFPEQAQAAQLRRLADQHRASRSAERSTRADVTLLEKRVADLEHDLGFAALLLGSLLDQLDKKGTLLRSDLAAAMHELDSIDGVADGRLDIKILRGMHR
jgi:hypothetical protein